MPSASQDDFDWAVEEFGDFAAEPICKWLEDRGFHLREDWSWKKPNRVVTGKEVKAICFLMDEWDFGGIRLDD